MRSIGKIIFLFLGIVYFTSCNSSENKATEDARLALEREKIELEKQKLALERERLQKSAQPDITISPPQAVEMPEINWDRLRQSFQESGYATVKVKRTYFHNAPREDSRFSSFLIRHDSFQVQDVSGRFVYCVFENYQTGITTRGWLKMTDLRPGS